MSDDDETASVLSDLLAVGGGDVQDKVLVAMLSDGEG